LQKREERMRVLRLAVLAVLLLAALLSSGPAEVRGVRVLPAGQTGNRPTKASFPPEQRPTRTAAARGSRAAAASGTSASLDASNKEAAPKEAAPGGGGGGSPPSTVFDPDRMSKRRVRRGSDPIHNKY
jgi:hypothetical protein